MGKCGGKACRLISMLAMTFSFFLVELIVGYATSSLALVADSFHMLSDVVALVVGLLSVRVGTIQLCCLYEYLSISEVHSTLIVSSCAAESITVLVLDVRS